MIAGVPIVGLLKACLRETYLLAPSMNNLPIAATCADLGRVSTIACIYSFVISMFSIALLTNFHCALYSSRDKSIQTQDKGQKTSGWYSPLFPQYDTISARIQSFNKWPLSVKHLSEAGFFN